MKDEPDTHHNPEGAAKLLGRGRTGFDCGVDVLRDHLRRMPESSGVYRMLSGKGDVLYVGKAKNLKKRVTSYTQQGRLPLRLQRMVAQIRNVEILVTETEVEALLLEANLIRHHMPPFNILLRDDKSYPYILVTKDHEFPQLVKHRGAKNRKGDYYGPFASAGAVQETINILQRGFLLRTCTDDVFAHRTRPCLQYHIKRCTAPCVGLVSHQAYEQQVREAESFLKGQSSEVQEKLSLQMQEYSDALDYEKAAQLRDRIKVLSSMQSRQDINIAGIDDADVFAIHRDAGVVVVQVFFFRNDRNYGARTYYPAHANNESLGEILGMFLAQFYVDKPLPPTILISEEVSDHTLLEEALSKQAGRKINLQLPKLGDKKRIVDHALRNAKEALSRKMAEGAQQKKILARVAELFGMSGLPERIEIYDNSHISGQFAVGAMVVAGVDGFIKKAYRKFNIRTEGAAGDDFAMMREVMQRRFKKILDAELAEGKDQEWPDLLLIDGGQGQLNKVLQVLDELGIRERLTVVGISKGPDRNAGREKFHIHDRDVFDLPPDDPVLYYLQRLRDEAHRFAIGSHRARRVKAISQTGLEDVPGIGATRKRALLNHFGSAKAVETASLDDLCRVKGISRAVAQKIYEYYRG